jgi:hypothetical protein
MNFKLPHGELRWVSIFWALVGLVGAIYFSFIAHNGLVAGICLFVLAMTLGIWCGSRGCAWTLLILYSVSAATILIREVILAQEWLRIGKVALNVWFTYALWEWLSSEDSKTRIP